jgi:hypothetical protein
MTAHYLNITARHRSTDTYVAGLSNFQLTEAESVNPETIITHPDISFYCFDDQKQQAIFVELPPGTDLSKVPFVYQAQYDLAQRLIAVPYPTFIRLADNLPAVNDQLIFIHTTGRSGSTLLSTAFNQIDTVLSLSELDTFTQLVYLRTLNNRRDPELRELLACTLRFVFKPTPAKNANTYVLKLQSEALEIMDLIHDTFPNAKNLFLYRDAIGWVASYYRILRHTQPQQKNLPLEGRLTILKDFFDQTLPSPSTATNERNDILPLQELARLIDRLKTSSPRSEQDFTYLAAYLDPASSTISVVQMLTLWWLLIMGTYLAQKVKDIPILPLRYIDLNSQPQKILSKVFQYCGLSTTLVNRAFEAFSLDSQAGTALARDNTKQGNQLRLSEEQVNEILNMLHRHPVLSQPDLFLPDTVTL